jgi:hypothetical protein
MTFIGKFTEKSKKVDVARYFIASFCTFELAQLRRAAEKSDIGAIYLRVYQQETYIPYPGGLRYSIEYSLRPQ